MTMVDSFEKIPVKIYPDLKAGSKAVAKQIADLIREKQKKKEKAVLGLSTGSTPKTLYAELVRIHKEEKLSFKNEKKRFLRRESNPGLLRERQKS